MIGLSSGSWAQIIVHMPGVEAVTAVEINPGYLELIGQRPEVKSLLANPKFKVDVDDGRRWLRKHPDERFDLVAMKTSFHYRAHMTNLLCTSTSRWCGRTSPRAASSSTTPRARSTCSRPRPPRIPTRCVSSTSWPSATRHSLSTALVGRPRSRLGSIDGKKVFDLAQAGDRARLEEVLAVADSLRAPPVDEGLESRESLLGKLGGYTPVSDDNMAPEWWSSSAPLKPFLPISP